MSKRYLAESGQSSLMEADFFEDQGASYHQAPEDPLKWWRQFLIARKHYVFCNQERLVTQCAWMDIRIDCNFPWEIMQRKGLDKATTVFHSLERTNPDKGVAEVIIHILNEKDELAEAIIDTRLQTSLPFPTEMCFSVVKSALQDRYNEENIARALIQLSKDSQSDPSTLCLLLENDIIKSFRDYNWSKALELIEKLNTYLVPDSPSWVYFKLMCRECNLQLGSQWKGEFTEEWTRAIMGNKWVPPALSELVHRRLPR